MELIKRLLREALDKRIKCKNCGWEWNSSDSSPEDMYVCHKCGNDNSPTKNLNDFKQYEQELESHGFEAEFIPRDGVVTIQIIGMPKKMQGQGYGSKIMNHLCYLADKNNVVLDLIPAASSTHSRTKLIKFYSKFGFIENKGLNSNPDYRHMYRKPHSTLNESNEQPIHFDNWKLPDLKQLKLEYKVEHELKGNEFWGSEEEFLEAAQNGQVIDLPENEDKKISYRSGTSSRQELMRLLRSYRSWGTFRTEETVQAIFDGFAQNRPMDLPIVIEFANGRRRIFSGNTRLDIAYQLGITPKVLLVQSQEIY